MVFGSFTEEALCAYAEQVRKRAKAEKVEKTAGTEWADNHGVGEHDSSFIDTDESQERSDYSECYDFTLCVRSDGSKYGIADGKKCRKGTETKVQPKVRSAKEKRGEAIRKRGERSLKRATAEKVLEEVRKEGAKERDAKRQREVTGTKERGEATRTQRIQSLVGKAQKAIDRLQAAIARTKEGQYKARVQAKIARLRDIQKKLQTEKERLQRANPPKGEGFGNIPEALRGRRD